MISNPEKLVIALPSKGRLQEQCINFLSGCGFEVRRVGNGREYVANLVGLDNVNVIFFRPDEIPAGSNMATLTQALPEWIFTASTATVSRHRSC